MTFPERPADAPYDIVGVGFGPSNLALAIALREREGAADPGARPSAVFLERQRSFGWHTDMLLDDALMQISFLKDLVTPRNPTSPYGFVQYLHARERLESFINMKAIFPTRGEFHDYLEWVASSFEDLVAYGTTVTAVGEAGSGGRPCFEVGAERLRAGVARPFTVKARNVVLAPGTRPRLPAGAATSDRVWHNSELLSRLGRHAADELESVVVVGAGQSAAETVSHVHRHCPRARVHAVFERHSYRTMEDSPYANTIFDPDFVDVFHAMPGEMREQVRSQYRNTNYSAVDSELIDDLYCRAYRESVHGRRRLLIHNLSEVVSVDEREAGVRVAIRSPASGETHRIDADLVIYATGYDPIDPASLLGELAGRCRFDRRGRMRVGRDYRIVTQGEGGGSVFLHGAATEHEHGISASLLSVVAVRAGEIVDAALAPRRPGAGVREAPARMEEVGLA